MAQLLDDSAIDDALVSLDGWRRVDNTIVREVPVDGAAADGLEAAVSKVADELDHHPVIDRADGGLRFIVWSHSAGGVTSKDLALAARIDEVVTDLG
jgi:4a-hydroxytetrahydrobiopterin dehydratase